jgi:hypothetical protein
MARRGTTVGRRVVPSTRVVPQRRVRAALSRRFRRSLFTSTVQAAVKPPGPGRRAIAYDDSARDFLDNLELAKVLEAVKKKLRRKIDLVGFDACLMNMIEVGYELRNSTDFIVGSPEVEPGDGWPYDKVLGDLAKKPSMSAQELGATIVKRYAEHYLKSDSVTQSLLDLSETAATARAVDALAAALIGALKKGEFGAIAKAAKDALRYDMKDFLDLGDLAAQMKKRCSSAAVKKAAQAVGEVVKNGLVAAERHTGSTMARSTGVSIYCPVLVREAELVYERLGFAKDTHWDEFLRAYDEA